MVANVLEYLQGIVPDILTRSEMQILPEQNTALLSHVGQLVSHRRDI